MSKSGVCMDCGVGVTPHRPGLFEGEGYDYEGRFGLHFRMSDIVNGVGLLDEYGRRRPEHVGRVRCPFATPREGEPLRFDL